MTESKRWIPIKPPEYAEPEWCDHCYMNSDGDGVVVANPDCRKCDGYGWLFQDCNMSVGERIPVIRLEQLEESHFDVPNGKTIITYYETVVSVEAKQIEDLTDDDVEGLTGIPDSGDMCRRVNKLRLGSDTWGWLVTTKDAIDAD